MDIYVIILLIVVIINMVFIKSQSSDNSFYIYCNVEFWNFNIYLYKYID